MWVRKWNNYILVSYLFLHSLKIRTIFDSFLVFTGCCRVLLFSHDATVIFLPLLCYIVFFCHLTKYHFQIFPWFILFPSEKNIQLFSIETSSTHLYTPLSTSVHWYLYFQIYSRHYVSEPGHGGLAERLPAGHRLRDVHGDPLPQLRRHDLRTGRRVSTILDCTTSEIIKRFLWRLQGKHIRSQLYICNTFCITLASFKIKGPVSAIVNFNRHIEVAHHYQ